MTWLGTCAVAGSQRTANCCCSSREAARPRFFTSTTGALSLASTSAALVEPELRHRRSGRSPSRAAARSTPPGVRRGRSRAGPPSAPRAARLDEGLGESSTAFSPCSRAVRTTVRPAFAPARHSPDKPRPGTRTRAAGTTARRRLPFATASHGDGRRAASTPTGPRPRPASHRNCSSSSRVHLGEAHRIAQLVQALAGVTEDPGALEKRPGCSSGKRRREHDPGSRARRPAPSRSGRGAHRAVAAQLRFDLRARPSARTGEAGEVAPTVTSYRPSSRCARP